MEPRRLARRRFLFFTAIFALTSVAAWFMADLLWRDGLSGIELALLAIFVVLFAHVATGFVTAVVGFYVVNRGGDSARIAMTLPAEEDFALASTAIVMPVCNEDVSRVFASKSDDKFAEIGWKHSGNGAPRITGVLAHIDCDIHEVLDGGDHDIVLGLVTALDVSHEGGPLVFFRGGYGRVAL